MLEEILHHLEHLYNPPENSKKKQRPISTGVELFSINSIMHNNCIYFTCYPTEGNQVLLPTLDVDVSEIRQSPCEMYIKLLFKKGSLVEIYTLKQTWNPKIGGL